MQHVAKHGNVVARPLCLFFAVRSNAGSTSAGTQGGSSSPGTRARRRGNRRLTRNESRYHSGK